MNKLELAKSLAEKMSVRLSFSTDLLNALEEIIIDELRRNEKVTMRGFGSFVPWQQSERLGRNPKNGKPHVIQPRISVKFKPGLDLLKLLNEKRNEANPNEDSL